MEFDYQTKHNEREAIQKVRSFIQLFQSGYEFSTEERQEMAETLLRSLKKMEEIIQSRKTESIKEISP